MAPDMDMYELQTSTDFFRVDDLLDFSNDDLFSSSSTTNDSDFVHHHNLPPSDNNTAGKHHPYATTSTDRDATNFNNFPDGLCVPSDDIAELEWLSNFVDDSMPDIPMSDLSGITEIRPEPLVAGRARSKRSRAASTHNRWTSMPESDIPTTGKSKQSSNNSNKKSITIAGEKSSSEVRKCTHCASEKTPQWRTGPKGPKTLCNACGVRFKSGRLVPEYRPAASPTFVLTQHSNSHRKVMELRRKKEILQQDNNNNNNHHQFYHHHHNHHDFKVC